LIQVTKSQFQEMFTLGILRGNSRQSKEFTVVNKNKKGTYKTRYVNEADYEKYMSMRGKSMEG